MEDEINYLQRTILRCRRLLRGVDDERVTRELERQIREAQQRLEEIERGRKLG